MSAHHNDWDTSVHKGKSSSSITSSSSELAALTQQMAKMRKDMLQMYCSNHQVNSVTPSCETCGGPHSYYECQDAGGHTQDIYATTGNHNSGAEPLVLLPPLSSSSKEVERDPEMITDKVLPKSTTRVPPPVVHLSLISRSSEHPPSPPTSLELPKQNPHQPLIPYPSRLNKEKLQDKSDIQIHKFLQMFKKLHFNISLAEALALMSKYHKMLKYLLFDKEKLLGLANTSLTENCSTALLKKLPEKLGDPGKFLIPWDFFKLEKCMALADLGSNINLMPLYVWKKLMLPKLVPTRMTLELANRSIAYPAGIAEDVFVQVGKFTFPVDFIVVDYDVNPRVPLILGRPFLRTAHALVDVYGEELILRDGNEKLIFHADSTSTYPHKHRDESINMINFIDITCEDHFNEVFNVQKSIHPLSGSPTPSSDPVVESLSPSLTPFGDIDFLLEETDVFLSLDDLIPPGIDNGIYDSKGDILFLDELLNDEIPRDLPPKELKDDELKTTKSSIEKPPRIDNEIFDAESDILFLEELLNDEIPKDRPPLDLNNDPEGDILFLENVLTDEPLETERSKIYTLIGEPPDTFLMGDEEIKFNSFKDIDDTIPILRVSETPLDSFDSSLDSFDMAFTNPLFELDSEYTLNHDNPIFDIQSKDSDASETETIMDEVQIDNLQSNPQIPPLFEALIPDMTMHDIILYQIRHGMVHSSSSSFYLGLLFPKGVFESHSLDSFELGDKNVVFDLGTLIIKGWIKHYYGSNTTMEGVGSRNTSLHIFKHESELEMRR
ncbi:reverse transcriptase domain-containing protein [Tanacetum coccineum]